MEYQEQFNALLGLAEAGLRSHIPPADTRPARLHEAMRYSLEAGGKRLRPVLLLAAAALGRGRADPVPASAAVECIHTYSLIHDDLPCMDDDDLRRGRPTLHRAFDEATALLAGDALLTHAFLLLATAYQADPALAQRLTLELASAAGSRRLIGGQMADLQAERIQTPDAQELLFIHTHKTAAMIEASLVLGALCGGCEDATVDALRETGLHTGLAFQIIDDILDVTATSEALGKTAGKDLQADKTTYVKLHGLEGARAHALRETELALAALARCAGDTGFLRTLITRMAGRLN